jgi:hypothetical protein
MQSRPYFYFQKGFFSPVGANALSTFASVPELSEIFSSSKREEGAFKSSGLYGVLLGAGHSDFIGPPALDRYLLLLKHREEECGASKC